MPSRRVEEIAQALSSGDEKASVENKFAEQPNFDIVQRVRVVTKIGHQNEA